MGRFADVARVVLNFEGGYSDHPDDKGGKTKYGITESTLRSAQQKGWVPEHLKIQDITQEHALAIYERGYWLPIRGDELPEPLDLILFDAAVNHGPGGAVRFLQESLNAILKGKPLVIDGSLGPLTMKALKMVEVKSGYLTWKNPELEEHFLLRYLCVDILMNRTEFYTHLAHSDPSQRTFFRGWIHHRVVRLAEEAGLEE